nr:stress-associated endoplasmic reticulum protein 2 isoform X3 [Pongo abelii]
MNESMAKWRSLFISSSQTPPVFPPQQTCTRIKFSFQPLCEGFPGEAARGEISCGTMAVGTVCFCCLWLRNVPKRTERGTWRDSCTAMFMAALSTIAKGQKQPRCPPTIEDERVN